MGKFFKLAFFNIKTDTKEKYIYANKYVYKRASYGQSSQADDEHFNKFLNEPKAKKKLKILLERFPLAPMNGVDEEYIIRHGAGVS